MNILVTGSNGQLGNQFKQLSKTFKQNKFFFATRYEVDITKLDAIEQALKSHRIDCIINCASFTGVDQAETDIENAMKVNALGVKNLASVAAKTNVFLVNYSTDYIFDGSKNQPYTENDQPNTKTAYGKSKLEGEREFFSNAHKGLIIRTSWLYSMFGKNFVKTIIEKIKENRKIKVVYDQVGSPTYTYDLAFTTLKILPEAVSNFNKVEVYNYSNEGVASWYDIAVAIAEIKKLQCTIEPVLSDEFPAAAKRPHFSVLNKSKIKNDFQIKIPHWRYSLCDCLKKIK